MVEKKNDEPAIGKLGITILSAAATGVVGWSLLGALNSPTDLAQTASGTATSVRDRADRIESDIARLEGDLAAIRDRLERSEKTIDRYKETIAYGTRFSREDYEDLRQVDQVEKANIQRQLDEARMDRNRLENRIDSIIEFVGRQYEKQMER